MLQHQDPPPIFLAVPEISLIYVAIRHKYLAQTLRLLIEKLAIIHKTIDCTQYPLTITKTRYKFALILRPIRPYVDPFPMRQAILEPTLVDVLTG